MFKLTTSVMGSIDSNRRPMGMMQMPMHQTVPVAAVVSDTVPVAAISEAGRGGAFVVVQEGKDVDEHYKPLDANRYATKKTIAQGMLDIALLTANASQLKYVLTIGQQHQFYTLMITLITISIVLQVLQATISLVLGSKYNINKKCDQSSANTWNNVSLVLIMLTVAVNVVASAFDMRETDNMAAGGGGGGVGGRNASVRGGGETAFDRLFAG